MVVKCEMVLLKIVQITTKGFVASFFGVCVAIPATRAVLHPFEFFNIQKQENNATPRLTTWYQNIKFGLEYSGGLATILKDTFGDSEFPEVVLISFYMITFASKVLLGLFADLLILSHILTLLFPVQCFIESLQSGKYSDYLGECAKGNKWEKWRVASGKQDEVAAVLQQYGALRGLSAALSESIGWSLVLYMVETIHTYGLHFHSSIFSNCFLLQLVGCLFYALTFLIYISSAEVSRKVTF